MDKQHCYALLIVVLSSRNNTAFSVTKDLWGIGMAEDRSGRIVDEDEFWRVNRDDSDSVRRFSLKLGFDQVRSIQRYPQQYTIRDGVICISPPDATRRPHRDKLGHFSSDAVDAVKLSYYPILKKGVVCRLAKIQEGDKEAALNFANEYGPLGHDQLVKREYFSGGDPLDWIWAHSRTLRLCLALMYCTQNNLRDDLRKSLQAIQRGKIDLQEFFSPSIAVGVLGDVVQLSRLARGETRGDLASVARRLYCDIITRNIKGIDRTLAPDDDDEKQVVSVRRYRALIQIAYWHLATAATEITIRRCQARHCQSLFIQGHGSNNYCPPYFDERKPGGGKAESPCALLERQHRGPRKGKSVPFPYGNMGEYIIGKGG